MNYPSEVVRSHEDSPIMNGEKRNEPQLELEDNGNRY